MGRKPLTDIRKKEIIEAFYLTAKKHGLENASVGKVAEEMGISKGLVLHYFKNKEELVLALNNFILDRYLEFLANSSKYEMTSKENIEAYIDLLFSRDWSDYIDDGVFYSFYALIYQNDKVRENFKAHHEELIKVLQLKLSEAVLGGVLRNQNIERLTRVIFALVDGAYYTLGVFIKEELEYNKRVMLFSSHAKSLLKY
ncbi:DNA-binding transcriptional regulator, AcrR family [Tenacibaculum sp. MAR_2009_124]|uniref:TetR family transcriptional regulator n=1 Tax=Tenacibaculum sp. MAR_2009_124 TaxID=1250059 RepID=UPI000896391D|nr:TetR family transcriptional regulator [Tenacibaculum sp. MAR_2009_124]SED22852.1 DNA-binding transcriptional regulator, AcrR family [Tenacibaculum sp. MAR_2009_124]